MRKFLSTLTLVGVCSFAAVPAFAAETPATTTEAAVDTTVEVTVEDDAATEADVTTDTTADAAEETTPEVTTPAVVLNPVTLKVRLDYIVDTDEENFTHTYTYYIVSEGSHSYWATSLDGKKNLWFSENEAKGQSLNVNDNFKATFDKDGRLLSIEKYVLQ